MYIDSYNTGKVEQVLALLAEDVMLRDCDYATGVREEVAGKSAVRAWLGSRAAEHDRFVAERFSVNLPQSLVGVVYRERTNDVLRSRGIQKDTSISGTILILDGDKVAQVNTGNVGWCSHFAPK